MSWWLRSNLGFSSHEPIKYNAQVVNNKVGEMGMAFKEEEKRWEYVTLTFLLNINRGGTCATVTSREVRGSLLGRKRKMAEMLVGRMVLVMTPNSWGD